MNSPVMQSLLDVTRKLCALMDTGDLEQLSELLDRREGLLNQQLAIVRSAHDSNEEVSQLGPSLQMLQQLDQDFVTLFTKKKEAIAEKLKQATNEKRLLAYSR